MKFVKGPSHSMGQIRHLYREDETFRAVWEDYRLTTRAHQHFKAMGEAGMIRAEEYRVMRDELKDEILEFIERRHMHQGGNVIGN